VLDLKARLTQAEAALEDALAAAKLEQDRLVAELETEQNKEKAELEANATGISHLWIPSSPLPAYWQAKLAAMQTASESSERCAALEEALARLKAEKEISEATLQDEVQALPFCRDHLE
jgi:hypothetical protein